MHGYEAITIIKTELENSGSIFNSHTQEAFEWVRKSVWKDIPMDVRYTLSSVHCSNCNAEIKVGQPKYCPECRQSLRWRLDEEWENR